jgi:hypothetical protein
MSDLLSASTLLLTVMTILYSLWYTEITNACALRVDDKAENRREAYIEARRVLWSKAIPLTIAALVLFAVNLPDGYAIAQHAANALWTKTNAPYNAVRTTFVAVLTVLGFLAGHTFCSANALCGHVRKLNPKRGNYG